MEGSAYDHCPSKTKAANTAQAGTQTGCGARVSCVRNSGNIGPAERRIWSGNRQGGGIANTDPRRPVLSFAICLWKS